MTQELEIDKELSLFEKKKNYFREIHGIGEVAHLNTESSKGTRTWPQVFPQERDSEKGSMTLICTAAAKGKPRTVLSSG